MLEKIPLASKLALISENKKTNMIQGAIERGISAATLAAKNEHNTERMCTFSLSEGETRHYNEIAKYFIEEGFRVSKGEINSTRYSVRLEW